MRLTLALVVLGAVTVGCGCSGSPGFAPVPDVLDRQHQVDGAPVLDAGGLLNDSSAAALTEFYVAPRSTGDGSGVDAGNAARHTSPELWLAVQAALSNGDVLVWFGDGRYEQGLTLDAMGHPSHSLTLQGISSSGAQLGPAEDSGASSVDVMLRLLGCQNVVLRDLIFSGNITQYALSVRESPGGALSHDIVIDSCTWQDLPYVAKGGIGLNNGSYNVTVKDCLFRSVGVDQHSHMIYSAHGSHDLTVTRNRFVDCAGASAGQ